MRKPTPNQLKWQEIIKQTERALKQITKITGEIFPEETYIIRQPKRITERSLGKLKATELEFLRVKIEEIIANPQESTVEEDVKKIRTREEYIRHPRISKKKPPTKHPLTAKQRSERSKKAWQTRRARMTPEEYEKYKRDFVDRMKRAERKSKSPKTAKQPTQKPKKLPHESDIIDYTVWEALQREIRESPFPERADDIRSHLQDAKQEFINEDPENGEKNFYKSLQEKYGLIDEAHYYLTYKYEPKARYGLMGFVNLLFGEPITLSQAYKQRTEYDNEMINPE